MWLAGPLSGLLVQVPRCLRLHFEVESVVLFSRYGTAQVFRTEAPRS